MALAVHLPSDGCVCRANRVAAACARGRACVCGNFADADPTQQSWTAQAEPSSLLASLKLGRNKSWTASEHDVKGAFLYASIPEGRIVIVKHPALWVE